MALRDIVVYYPSGTFNKSSVQLIFGTGGIVPAGNNKGPRILFIDNIRILLICLVITTHSAVTYGGAGSWYFKDIGTDAFAPAILTMINSLNQSFFMGFFLLIAAYFIPGSLSRKGPARYVHDRLVRLGIPLVVWVVGIGPMLVYLLQVLVEGYRGTLLESYLHDFIPFHGLGLGPMWFVFLLLVATLVYVVWCTITGSPHPAGLPPAPFPSFGSLLMLGILLGFVTFIVRIFQPIGSVWDLFDLQFPFFPQYIAFFIIGIYAARNNWFTAIPAKAGKRCAWAALILVLMQPVLLLLLTGTPGGFERLLGGLYWEAAAYSLWEQMTGVMIMIGLLWLFSVRFNHQGRVARAMGLDTYTVYIIHPVVIVLVAIAITHLVIPTLLKFGLLVVLTICIAFILAHGIRAIPGVSRVL
jgi:glucan biosynthesis protein C